MSSQIHKVNTVLRRERQLRGWSQQKVAKLLDTSEDVVSRWERGERKASPYFQEKLCVLYGKSAEELGFIPSKASTSVDMLSHAENENQLLHDRLNQAESIVNLAWETWFASRPRQAVREITRLLPQLEKVIFTSHATIHVLHAKELAIRCHGLLGAVCVDALQNDTAFYHYMQAHRYGEEIHDVGLTATYLALTGDVLRRQNDKVTAIRHMEQAREQVMRESKAVQGHVLQLLAYTYADTGKEHEFVRAIAEATDMLAFTDEGRDTVKREFIPFEIYEIQGKAHRDLGKPLQAIPYLERAEQSLNQAESVTPRWHALLEISRGQAYCDVGDIVTGVDLASRGFLLAHQCSSPRQMNRVRKLLRKLEASPVKGEKKVAELRELVHEVYLRMDLDK